MKSFSGWTIAEVEKEFQVTMQDQSNLLDSWLNPAIPMRGRLVFFPEAVIVYSSPLKIPE